MRTLQCEFRIRAADFDLDGPNADSDVLIWAGQDFSGVRLAFGRRFGDRHDDFIPYQLVHIDGKTGEVAALLQRLARLLQAKEATLTPPARR